MRQLRESRNLYDGVYISLVAPGLPTCADCQRWVYDDNWQKRMWRGEPMPRHDADTPCFRCPKARDGKPNPGAELTPRNWQAYEYWLASKSGLPVAWDSTTRANFALVQLAHERAARSQAATTEQLLRAFTKG